MGPSTPRFDVGAQRLVTPPIRGRAGELKVIGALVRALVQGRGGVLVIEGPPGIGKSRLLTEVMALADKCGARHHETNTIESNTAGYRQNRGYCIRCRMSPPQPELTCCRISR